MKELPPILQFERLIGDLAQCLLETRQATGLSRQATGFSRQATGLSRQATGKWYGIMAYIQDNLGVFCLSKE